MKTKRFFLTLAFSAFSLFTYTLYSQTGSGDTRDSVQFSKDQVRQQQATDKDRLENARTAKKQAEADSKRTQQVNRDAMNASRESKKAFREEKKAQKARKAATQQAEKASDARKKSDQN